MREERGAGKGEWADRRETTGVEEIGVEEMESGVGEIKAAVWKAVGAGATGINSG